MKTILLNIIKSDNSYNKSATRYLYKTHPNLWEEIVNKTNFLPTSAKPKQRIWHIINDIWEIPKCPITGEQVKWWENRYLETISRSAKATKLNLTGALKNRSLETNEKRKQGNLNAVKRGRRYRDKSTYTEEQKLKTKQTFLLKYGVENPSHCPKIKEKIYNKAVDRGCVPFELRSKQRLYYDAVLYYTRINYRKYKHIINPLNLPRKQFHLDHIFSVMAGFWAGVPPEVIGHWTNLQMLYATDNLSKNASCHKTIESLFDEYYNESWKEESTAKFDKFD